MFLPLLNATFLAGLDILQMEQISLKCWGSSQPEHFQEFSSMGLIRPNKLVSLSQTVC